MKYEVNLNIFNEKTSQSICLVYQPIPIFADSRAIGDIVEANVA